MKRLLSVLFWSVLAAAFIGPGTVAVASAAGASHGFGLLWALAFSTLATLVLQEAAGRITAVTGRDLGQALRQRFSGGASGALVLVLVVGAIVVGCAAYEAGNILGGVDGAGLAFPLPRALLTVVSVALAAILLWVGSPQGVARFLAILVGVMGLAFLTTAGLLAPSPGALARGTFVPSFPAGSALVILGLVGTTVVPYNLFLGSGLARGQDLKEMRFGLAVAVILGGVISMGVLVVGSAVAGPMSFESVSRVLGERLGGWARSLFAAGLFSAGLSSAVTAPLAAAITARSLFGREDDSRWAPRGHLFRGVWMGVLAVGLAVGLSGVKPLPVILLAQALNGLLLPLVAVFLLAVMNDRRLLGEEHANGPVANLFLVLVVLATWVLGATGLVKAGKGALSWLG